MTEKQLKSFKKLVESIIEEYLDEIKNQSIDETSATGGGEAYLTPKAFEGGKKNLRKKRASLGNSIGYRPVPNWEELEGTAGLHTEERDVDEDLKESKNVKTKKSTKKSPEHEFRSMMKDARDKLIEVENIIKSALKHKQKNGINSDKMGVLSQKSINKINSRIYSLLTKFQGMKN